MWEISIFKERGAWGWSGGVGGVKRTPLKPIAIYSKESSKHNYELMSLREREREGGRENSNSNSNTLFYKDCSLGSVKNLSDN